MRHNALVSAVDSETCFHAFSAIQSIAMRTNSRGRSERAQRGTSNRILPESLQQIERTRVFWRGRKLTYFGGCDYFRLSSHPEVVSALKEGVDRFGLNVAASRFTTG